MGIFKDTGASIQSSSTGSSSSAGTKALPATTGKAPSTGSTVKGTAVKGSKPAMSPGRSNSNNNNQPSSTTLKTKSGATIGTTLGRSGKKTMPGMQQTGSTLKDSHTYYGYSSGQNKDYDSWMQTDDGYSSFLTKYVDYRNSDDKSQLTTEKWGHEAKYYSNNAIDPDMKAKWDELYKAIGQDIYDSYQPEIDNAEQMVRFYEKKVSDAENTARSAQDVVTLWDDPYGLYNYDDAVKKSETAQGQLKWTQGQLASYEKAVADAKNKRDAFFMPDAVIDAQKRLEKNDYKDLTFSDPNLYATDPSMLVADKGLKQKEKDQEVMDAWESFKGEDPHFYNNADIFGAWAEDFIKGRAAGWAGLAGLGIETTGYGLNAYSRDENVMNAFANAGPIVTANPTVNAAIASTKTAQTAPPRVTYTHIEDAEAALSGFYDQKANIDRQLANINAQLNQPSSLFTSGEGTGKMFSAKTLSLNTVEFKNRADLQKEKARLEGEKLNLQTQIDNATYQKKLLTGQSPTWMETIVNADADTLAQGAYNVSAKLETEAQEACAKAKASMGEGGGIVYDVAMNLANQASDHFDSLLMGGVFTPVDVMAMREAGSAATHASQKEGADLLKRTEYSISKGTKAWFTEKMFGVFDKFNYGKGVLSKTPLGKGIEKTITDYFDTIVGKWVGKMLVAVPEEQAEELLDAMLDPYCEAVLEGEEYLENYAEHIDPEEIKKSLVIAGLVTVAGGLGSLASGQFKTNDYQESVNRRVASDFGKMKNLSNRTIFDTEVASAPKGSLAREVIDSARGHGDDMDTRQQKIVQMLQNPAEVNLFEAATGKTIEGDTISERWASVESILSNETPADVIEKEGRAELDKQKGRNSRHTQAILRLRELNSEYPDGNIPVEKRLDRSEANLLMNAGLITRAERDAISKPLGVTDSDIKVKNGSVYNSTPLGWQGRSGTEYQQGHERGTAAKAAEAGAVSPEESLRMANEEAKAEWQSMFEAEQEKQDAQKLDNDGKIEETPEQKRIRELEARVAELDAIVQGKKEAPSETPVNVPQSDSSPEGITTPPETSEKVKPTKESTTEKPTETQRKADNAKVDQAHKDKSTVTFDVVIDGSPRTVVYDGAKNTYKVLDENGTPVQFIVKAGAANVPVYEYKGVRSLKTWLNQVRKNGGVQPTAEAGAKATPETPPAPEAPAEAVPAPEPAPEAEAESEIHEVISDEEPEEEQPEQRKPAEYTGFAKQIQDAESVEALEKLYSEHKEEFLQAYEEITGGTLDEGYAHTDIANLYEDLHQEEPAKPVAPVEGEVQEAETEGEPEHTGTSEQRREEATQKIKNFELEAEDVVNLTKDGTFTRDELAQLLGHKFNPKKIDPALDEKARSQRERGIATEQRRQIRRWYVTQKYQNDPNSLSLAEKEILAKAGERKARDAKESQERSEDRKVRGTDKEVFGNAQKELANRIGNDLPYREFTKEDNTYFKQWMMDQITSGDLTAEEIQELLWREKVPHNAKQTKRIADETGQDFDFGLENYSQRLIDLAASRKQMVGDVEKGLHPKGVQYALWAGFKELTGEAIHQRGKAYQLEGIKEQLAKWRGKEGKTALDLHTPAPQVVKETPVKEQKNEKAQPRVDTRRVPTSNEDLYRLIGEDVGRRSGKLSVDEFLKSVNRQDTPGEAYARITDEATEYGAKFLSYDEADNDIKAVIASMLGDDESGIPVVTVMDCSGMTKEDFNEHIGVRGLVIKDAPQCGVILFVNTPGESHYPVGVAVLHEPFHYYKAINSDKANLTGILFDAVLKQNKLQGITFGKEGAKEARTKKIITNIIQAELKFSGYGILQDYLPEGKTVDEKAWKSLMQLSPDDQFAKLTNLLTYEKDGKTKSNLADFMQDVYEEAIANVSAGNPALDSDSFKATAFMQAMREAIYDSGVVPRGTYERLEGPAKAFSGSQGKISKKIKAANEKAEKGKAPKAKTTEKKTEAPPQQTGAEKLKSKFINSLPSMSPQGISQYFNGTHPNLIALSLQNNVTTGEALQLFKEAVSEYVGEDVSKLSAMRVVGKVQAANIKNKPKVKKLPDKLDVNSEAATETAEKPPKPTTYAEWQEQPPGVDKASFNEDYAKATTTGEKRSLGATMYESISRKAMNETARKNIRNALNDKDLGIEFIMDHFRKLDPANANRLDLATAKALYQMLANERRTRGTNGNRIVDKRLPASVNKLLRYEQGLEQFTIAEASQAGGVLQQTAYTPPEDQALNNAAKQFLNDQDPSDIDPLSYGAKMYKIVDDDIRYVMQIDDDLNTALENAKTDAEKDAARKEATQKMLDHLTEVNNLTRGVNQVYGPVSGKIMQGLETAMLNRIANKSADAYNTIKAMTVSSINRISADFKSVGSVNTLKQIRYLNMLSNPATIVNNILNNLESSTTGAVSQNIARLLTNARAKDIMGSETLVRNSNFWLPGRNNRELNSYMLTKGAESVLSLYYGLEVDTSKLDDQSRGGLQGEYQLGTEAKHNQTDNALGRILTRFQFLSGLGMSTTDTMAIARAYKGMERNIDAMDATPEHKQYLKQAAMETAAAQMYHNTDGALSKAMLSLRDLGNNITLAGNDDIGKIGLGDVVMPFVNVPANVAARALRASPLGVLVGIGQYFTGMHRLETRAQQYNKVQEIQAKLNDKAQRKNVSQEDMEFLAAHRDVKKPTDSEVIKTQLKLGESVTNAAVTAFAYAMSALGCIKNFDDEDDKDLKRLYREKGFTGLQINLSKMLRGGKGADGKRTEEWDLDNDIILGGSWLEVMAIPLAAGFTIWNNAEKEDESIMKTIIQSPLSTLNTLLDAAEEVPGIKQISEIWNAYENLQYYDEMDEKISKAWAGVAQYGANTAASFVIPNIVAQGAAGFDNTVRDVYSGDSTGEIAKNIFMNKIPGLRQKLPEAKDSLGNTRTYGPTKGWGVANRMLLPGTGVQVWSRSPLEKEYTRLIKEGYTGVMPKKSAPTSIEVEGKKYATNAQERRVYDDKYTTELNALHTQLLNSAGYKNLNDDEKVQAMKDIDTLLTLYYKQETLKGKAGKGEIPNNVHVKLNSWEEAFFDKKSHKDLPDFLNSKYALKEVYKDGEVLDYKGLDNWVQNEWPKLSETEQALIESSNAQIPKMYKAYEDVGMDSESFAMLKGVHDEYDDKKENKADDETLSGINRDLVRAYYDTDLPYSYAEWAENNMKLWTTIPAKIETPQKIVEQTGMSWAQVDDWLDTKENTKPLGGHKELTKNQTYMMIRDSRYTEAEKWKLLEYEATDPAWENFKPYKDEGYTVADALANATWKRYPPNYRKGKTMRYDVIYDEDYNIVG